MADMSERFLTEDLGTRVTVVVLTEAVEKARSRHMGSDVATVALGRAMVCGALLAAGQREGGRINLQLVGQGPLGSLSVDASRAGTIRASIRVPAATIPINPQHRADVAPGVGRSGEVHVLTEATGGQYERGTSELVSGQVDEDVDHYIHRSMQVPAFMAADVVLDTHRSVKLAAGVLVEMLPDGTDAHVLATRKALGQGGLFKLLAEHPGVEAEPLAHLVMEGLHLRAMQGTPWKWFCPCSRERVLSALTTLGEATLRSMLAEDKGAEATCDFCRQDFKVSAAELQELIHALEGASRAGGGGMQ